MPTRRKKLSKTRKPSGVKQERAAMEKFIKRREKRRKKPLKTRAKQITEQDI